MLPTPINIVKKIRNYCKVFTNSCSLNRKLSELNNFSLSTEDIYERWDKYPSITAATPPPNYVVMIKYNNDTVARLVWEPKHQYFDASLHFYLPSTATYYKNEDRIEISYKSNYFSKEEIILYKLPEDHKEIPQISILKGEYKQTVPDEIIAVKNKIISDI